MTFREEEYNSLIQDIFHRFPSVADAGFGGAYKPGLRHMEDFCKALGHPEKAYRTIHIAGTNGKGSVANMLAAALTASGLSAGLYTSPHIIDFRERMRIGGTMVDKQYVFDFLQTWLPYITEHNLSFFEITTGLAFRWFADSHADVAVIETGLGGRLDSTNVITPVLSIITSIGLDHCDLLGHTREAIAGEKAGIIKAGIPALIGTYDSETAPVFEQTASHLQSPLIFADQASAMPDLIGHLLPMMDLQGSYQAENLRTVLTAIDLIKPSFPELSDDEKVHNGIANTATLMDFHGRWEKLSDSPYTLCDIGHNAPALRHNFAQLDALLDSGRFHTLIIIYGIMADKDLDAIIPLFPSRATIILTTPSTPRALPANKIAEHFPSTSNIHITADVAEALTQAHSITSTSPSPLLYIGGSTYVVSDAVKALKAK